jgi:hypothetical protein
MYLTLSHPEVLHQLKDFGSGIWAARIAGEYCLIIKASKEIILTAKINKGFDFYLAPIEVDSKHSIAILTAFYDDDDEPLVIKTPLVVDDESTQDFLELLTNDDFEVFFFDEHNRELLSCSANGNLGAMRKLLAGTTFLGSDVVPQILDKADYWFARRNAQDDEAAFAINLVENLFPDDCVILDLDEEKHSFIGSQTFSSTSLERVEPGAYQELDIVFLLQRVFESGRIYLNPTKEADEKEFVDIMVLGNEALFLIQAKDSPNTEKILRNTIKRKRARSISQLAAAAKQLSGAITYANKNKLLRFIHKQNVVEVDISGKQLIGIIVIKELFNDSFEDYSAIAYDLMDTSRVPAVFFDYPELNMMTMHCDDEKTFLGAIHQIFSFAMENEQFPRLRYSRKSKLI